jgi:hypothetical protein
MEPRPTSVLIALLALACFAGGVAVLHFMPTMDAQTAAPRAAAALPVAPSAVASGPAILAPARPPQALAQLESFGGRATGLRAMGLRGQLPAPVETPPASLPEAAAAAQIEAQFSFPETLAPAPPSRPRDLALAAPQAPLPPPRPVGLTLAEAVAAAPGEPAAAESPAAASPLFPGAPLPPVRPRGLAGAAELAPATAPAPGVQVAALPQEPVLQAPPVPAPVPAEPPGPARMGMGAPVFIRIFKREGQLELWLKSGGRYALYRTYPICKWSGHLGPKIKEADYQSPEGFYSVSARQLHPHSNYHRAFNVGYPNAFDRQNGRTGGLVMVHGNCKSVGCFAMTDKGIEEIYGFVAAALAGGQREVAVHIFPFHMTETAIAHETGSGGFMSFLAGGGSFTQYAEFWRNLKQGYDLFEQTGEPPTAYACGDHYAFGANGGSCKRVAGW